MVKKLLFVCVTVLLFASVSKAQIININTTTYTNPTPHQALVEQVLLGPGVSASNFSYIGSPDGIGYFNAVGTGLGIDSGVVLSTGIVTNIVNPVGFNQSDFLTGNAYIDPDLSQILGNGNMNDVTILEFDFIPLGDSVKFDYVFASEEYPEYVCQFNDAFGFFLSGPGINGPYSNGAENIALIPGTSIPVTINNVNNGANNNPNSPGCPAQNPQYYVINSGQGGHVYDGFTTVLTALAQVQCGETYHVKLAICDAIDNAFDSGVFLRARSFVSQAINVTAATLAGDSTIVEGCAGGEFIFNRPGNAADTLIIPISIGGTALNGVDYVPALPDSVVFLPGQNTVILTVEAIQDFIAEPSESIEITFIQPGCGGDTLTYTLWIVTPCPMQVSAPDVQTTCPCEPVTLTPSYNCGYPPYVFSWSTGDSTLNLNVAPCNTTVYFFTVSSPCTGTSATESIQVAVPTFTPMTAEATDTSIFCPGSSASITALPTGGFPPYTYTWTQGGNVVGNTQTITVTPPQTSDYIVQIADACGTPVAVDTSTVTQIPYVFPVVTGGPNVSPLCPGNETFMTAAALGSAPPFTFNWTTGTSGINDSITTIASPVDTFVVVTITDICNNTSQPDTILYTNPIYSDVIVRTPNDTLVCPGTDLIFTSTATGGAGQYSFNWERIGLTDDISGNDEGISVVKIMIGGEFILIVTDQCNNEGRDTIKIDVRTNCDVESINVITPNGDGSNQKLIFKNLELYPNSKLAIFNRWGKVVYENPDYKNDWEGGNLSDGTYFYSLQIPDQEPKSGFFKILR
jgi:gliding motility-associated-like protein